MSEQRKFNNTELRAELHPIYADAILLPSSLSQKWPSSQRALETKMFLIPPIP
jgi:hypothetical protein